jgi:hypothetical protein
VISKDKSYLMKPFFSLRRQVPRTEDDVVGFISFRLLLASSVSTSTGGSNGLETAGEIFCIVIRLLGV